MSDLEAEHSFLCPDCMANISIQLDFTGGRRQAFTIDCEVCCRPITVRMEAGPEGIVRFDVEQES